MNTTATYNSPPALDMRTSTSFYTADVPALADYLITNDFDLEPPAKPDVRIYGRLWRRGTLLTLFQSGAVLVQGDDQAAGVRLLLSLCAAGEVF